MKLYRHQKLTLEYMRLNDYFALFQEQGCGKTLPTLCRILELFKEKKIQLALVVAPKATMGAWYRDMEMFSKKDQSILEKRITVINYDSVWRKGKGYDRRWDCIVLDESHWIKNRSSKRSSFLLKLSLGAKYHYILTGTPIGNGHLEDIWAQYAFLNPYRTKNGKVASNIFGTYSQFEKKYCILNQYWKPYRYLNVAELQDIISEHCYRVKKVDCLDLPEKLPDEIYEIEQKEPKLYKQMAKDSAILDFELIAENPLARMAKLRQMCSGFINTDTGTEELKCEKPKVLGELLDGWDKKLVIFCEFKHSIHTVCQLLKKRKIKYITLDGEQKDKLIWRKFQDDPKIQVIVCQYRSASQGIDLYAADTILYYEPTISSNVLEQSRDRIHRVGQKSKCSYIHFVTKGTIEKEIYKALQGYSDFGEKLFTEYMEQYQRSFSK